MNTERPHRRKSAWSTAVVIVGIVAAGTVVAGLLNDPQADAVAIPGCDEVIQPEELQRVNYAIAEQGSFGDPWLSEPKAAAMSDALAEALPVGAVVEPISPWPPLLFEPMGEGMAEATAFGRVSVGGNDGQLSVGVVRSDVGPGPCFAGFVEERQVLDDGIVLDFSGHRVIAYVPDGSLIDVSGDNVFTQQQLVDIATAPGLRVGDPVS